MWRGRACCQICCQTRLWTCPARPGGPEMPLTGCRCRACRCLSLQPVCMHKFPLWVHTPYDIEAGSPVIPHVASAVLRVGLHHLSGNGRKWQSTSRPEKERLAKPHLPFPRCLIATEVKALHAPGHCLPCIAGHGSHHIERQPSTCGRSSTSCHPVLPGLTLRLQDSMAAESVIGQLVCRAAIPSLCVEPGVKVLRRSHC